MADKQTERTEIRRYIASHLVERVVPADEGSMVGAYVDRHIEQIGEVVLYADHLAAISTLAHQLSQEKERSAALETKIAQPWTHSEHWRNPETGQVECECCCGWALDAADNFKRTTAILAENARLTEAMRVKEEECDRLGKAWISVEDRLPEYDTLILLGSPLWAGGVHAGYWRHSNEWIGWNAIDCSRMKDLPGTDPTHWMPIPEPPALLAARRTQEREEHGG